MRVNSAFKGFFNNRVAMGYGFAMVILAIFFISSSFTQHSDRDLLAKQTNLHVRQIGDQLLLQSGDSTSRVLPVTEIKEGTFLLKFENEFVFNHDSLMRLSKRLLPETQFPSGYTVTVHECSTARIVYGFQINNTSRDILACRGRREPTGCYAIEITFPDLYANIEPTKADIDQPTAKIHSLKVDPKETNAVPIAIGTEELKSIIADSQEANPIPIAIGIAEFKATTFDFPLINLVYGGMLVLLAVAFVIARFDKSLVPVPVHEPHQDHSIIKESVQEMTALGKFLFDVKDQCLLLGSEVISLTDKEFRVLELLNKNFGELIPRETLMQQVWINEGVITGRSLDMFVSKLRKKLSSDPELRITNVHGKGYKLEIPAV